MLVKVCALFYGASVSLARGFKLPVYRPLLFPLAVLVYGLNFLIPSFAAVAFLDATILRDYGWAFALPTLVWLLVKLRSKGGPKHSSVL